MRIFLVFILAAIAAHAQHVDILGSDYPANSLTILNSKPAVRTGTSDPTGNCKAGLDLYVRTDTAELFYCGALNVWAKAVNTSGSYPNPAWISSLAWAKITGAPTFQLTSEKGAANGYASLNASSLIPIGQMCTGAGSAGQYCDPSTRLWTSLGSGESPLTFSPPLSRSVNTISLAAASGSVNGYLSSTDWGTFNAKENALTFSAIFNRTGNAIALASQSANLFIASPNGSAGVPGPRAIVSADLPATIAANTTGNAATSTAHAANPTNCTAGQAAGGVSANGTAEDCFTPAAALTVELDGATIGTRSKFNVRSETGGGVTLGCSDDSLNGKVTCGWQINRGVTDAWYLGFNVPNAMGAAGTIDGRAMSPTNGMSMPTAATVGPVTNGYFAFGTNALDMFAGRNGATEPLAWRDTSVAPLLISRTNASSTGTTVNLLAKLNASAEAVLAATSDTNGILGVVASGAGTTGSAKIATVGTVPCVADNSTTIGNFVIIGTTTAGRCRDGGSTYPTSGQVLGRWLSAVSAGSSGTVLLFGLGQQGVSAGSGDVVGPASSVANRVATYANTTGKLLQDSGKLLPSGDVVGTSDAQTLDGKTINRPIISTYTIASPPSSPTTGQIVIFTDAATPGNCSSGSGSSLALCRYNGSVYVAVGDGGGSDGNGGTAYYMRMGSQRVNASSTSYAGFAVDGFNGTESVVQGRTLGGTATELRINPGGFQPGDGAMVCTLRQNGSDTALAVTLAAGSNSSTKGTGSVSITDGAQLSIGCANAASSGQSATVVSFLLRII